MKIKEIYQRKKPVFSIEVCPPSKEKENCFFESVERLLEFKIDFFSVTNSPFGKKTGDSLAVILKLRKKYKLEGLLHLPVGDKSSKELQKFLFQIKKRKIQNLLVLKGDVKKEGGYNFAFEALREIKKNFPNYFCLGVAGFPETPPNCPSFEKNLEYLKVKIEAGGDFVITQCFFEAEKFLRFREGAEKMGIKVPIIPGLLPLSRLSDLQFLSKFLKVSLPEKLCQKIQSVKEDQEAVKKIFQEHLISLSQKLLENEVDGLHFFTRNHFSLTSQILKNLF